MQDILNIKSRAAKLLCSLIAAPTDDPGFVGDGGGVSGSGGDPIPPSPDGAPAAAANPALITSSGGLIGFACLLLIPLYDPEFKVYTIGTLDPTDFNTEEDCQYQYRQEIISPGRQITISGVRFVYRDLGICKVRITVRSVSNPVDKYVDLTIGSAAATGKLITAKADFVVTGERPQVIIDRFANNGPLSITEVSMITDVEVAEQM